MPTSTSRPRDGAVIRSFAFETFFAVSLDLLVIRDASFNIVAANPAWRSILGHEPEALVGVSMLSFVHPDDSAATLSQMRRVGAEKDVWGFINRYRCRDGSYRSIEWLAHQEGELVYGVGRDVTERLAFEKKLAETARAAEAASQAKSDFLANMSHEIRTPLNGVIGVAGALARTELSEPQYEMAQLILNSGQTLERVVSDVLDFSKIEAGRLELELAPFDLRRELDGVLDLFAAPAMAKGLDLSVRYDEAATGRLVGDAVRLKQILGNLVGNAIKFTDRGGIEISIGLGPSDDPEVALLSLEVRDTGIGFDATFAEQLFQRFRQADGSITRRFGGTGLGLSICQALVKMMDGDIGAASEPGHGSRFWVRLPLPRALGANTEPDAPGRRPQVDLAGGRQVRVLVAEDHLVNQRVVELILGPAGVHLTMAANGVEALRAFSAETFSLVLMDMQMPVMDGLATTRAMRAVEAEQPTRIRTPIIMLSANAMSQHVADAIAAGADRHLSKPVTPEALLDAVAEILSGSAEVAA